MSGNERETIRSLYVHAPFCARRCSYCDFAVEALADPPVEEWLRAIEGEIRLVSLERGWDGPLELDTLYVGGGTPSLLGTGAMREMLRRLEPYARLRPGAEWTCEANPESFTSALAEDWRAAGINRLSLGAQTFHAPSLRWMGRIHGADGPERALRFAREAGFDDVSLDLIFGLPERLQRDWAADLERIVELAPEHVSLYGLTAEAGAPLGRWVSSGREEIADEDRYAEEFLLAHRVLTGAGFEHYEVSNFGRPDKHSRHNFAYWTGAPYAALGPGAHAWFPPERRWNLRSWYAYRDAVAAGRSPLEGRETVDEETAGLEHVWLGLRTRTGVSLSGLVPEAVQLLERAAANGLATIRDGVVRLTAEGWLVLDELAVSLSKYMGPGRVSAPPDPFDVRSGIVQIGANPVNNG